VGGVDTAAPRTLPPPRGAVTGAPSFARIGRFLKVAAKGTTKSVTRVDR